MSFADFRQRALGEGLRYREERMVFLRELAQNSRDAGARKVGVAAVLEGDDVVISLGDDGCGMTFEHARRFLFTLYASSKEDQERAAGRFGVGFWSVLLFNPERIVLESMNDEGESWALALDGDLQEPRRVECGLSTRGTRVTLRKAVAPSEGQRIKLEVERALIKYCRYLRRNDRDASALPVYLNGKRVDKPFAVGGPCWMAFRDGSVEGAVGLGNRPRVELYARGILVWRGTTLDELRHGAGPEPAPAFPEGLAPVYLLCGNDLSVTMDRRAVIDDRALSRVRLAARRRMRELLGLYLDGLGPRPWYRRLLGWLAGRLGDLRAEPRPGPWVGLLLILAGLAGLGILVPRLAGMTEGGSAAESTFADGAPTAALDEPRMPERLAPLGPAPRFDGPLVHPLGRELLTFMRYSPAGQPVLLRLLAAEKIHPGRGPRSAPAGEPSPAPAFRCAAGCTTIETVVDAGAGALNLPTPTGHRVDTGSVWLAGEPVREVWRNPEGQALLLLPGPVRGGLRYRTGPAMEELEEHRQAALSTVPEGADLSADLTAAVEAARALPSVADRVELLRAFVERRVAYDRSEPVVEAFARHAAGDPSRGWTEFVAGMGRGDCDVKNGLLVILARSSGVPARLAVGYSGIGGRALPGLHAWAEYHDRGWLAADATGATASPPPAAPVPEAPPTFAGDGGAMGTSRPPWLAPAGAVAGSMALAAVLLALFFLLSGRVRRRLVAPGGGETRRRVAGEMIAGVLAHPETWSGTGALESRPLLPVLGDGGAMSLAEARGRGRRARLWYSSGRHSLVRRMVARGARILDAGDPVFGGLAARVPGAVDLDEVAGLSPAAVELLSAGERPAGRLIEGTDGLAAAAGLPPGTIVPCPGLEQALCRDVDLSGLPLAGEDAPARFVAVGTSHPQVRHRAALAAVDGPLACFMLLDLILPRSSLLGERHEAIRRRAAARAIEERT